MPTITFRGARIRYIDLRRDEEAGVFARVHLTADYSTPVMAEMGWAPVDETITSCKLIGRLAALNMVLTPADAKLSRSEVQVECSEVSDFQLAPLKNDDGEVHGHELRFIARTIEAGAVALLENYLRVIGASPAALAVSYSEQSVLELEDDGAKQRTLEEMPDAEVPELEDGDGPALASVVEMHGTTAEMKKARRKRQSADPIPNDPAAPEWRTADEIYEGVPHHISEEVQ